MAYYFFFDVDGTLLPFGSPVPESALSAMRSAQEKGHRMFLSTGRSFRELPYLSDFPFDGYVLSAGLEARADGKEVYNQYMDVEDYEDLMSYMDEHGLHPLVQTDEGTYLTRRCLELFEAHFRNYLGSMVELNGLIVVDEIPDGLKARKLVVLSEDGSWGTTRIMEDFGERMGIVKNTVGLPFDLMCEIPPRGVTKVTGIERILEYYGATQDQAVGIGDGSNDVEMIDWCGIGIAMGNADDAVKECADWITTDVDRDGVRNALEHVLGEAL